MTRQAEKPHFSDFVLDVSERFQHHLGHTAVGSRVIRAVAGSSSESYVQLDWRSQKVNADTTHQVEVPGDPEAGYFTPNWRKAAVIAVNSEALGTLKEDHPHHDEAVSYITKNKPHIGTMAIEGCLLEELNGDENAVAVRRGRSAAIYAAGVWLPSERVFISAAGIRLENENVPVDSMPREYPGIRLG